MSIDLFAGYIEYFAYSIKRIAVSVNYFELSLNLFARESDFNSQKLNILIGTTLFCR